jgi:hypothetical protein
VWDFLCGRRCGDITTFAVFASPAVIIGIVGPRRSLWFAGICLIIPILMTVRDRHANIFYCLREEARDPGQLVEWLALGGYYALVYAPFIWFGSRLARLRRGSVFRFTSVDSLPGKPSSER